MPHTLSLASRDGVRIACDVYPAPSGKALGTLVVAPGFWRRRKSPVMAEFAETWAAKGLDTLLLDFRGHGDSEGAYTFGIEEPQDLATVLDYAVERNPSLSIGVVGFSLGGSIAVETLAARHDFREKVRAVVTVCSPADFALLKIPLLKAREALPHLSMYEAVRPPRISLKAYLAPKPRYADFAGDVSPSALHVVHTANDWLVDTRHARLLFDAAREPKRLHLLEEGGESLHADALLRRPSEAFLAVVGEALGGGGVLS